MTPISAHPGEGRDPGFFAESQQSCRSCVSSTEAPSKHLGPGLRRDERRETWRSAALIGLILWSAPIHPARAQERSPAAAQALAELAYVLGESHALRQACEGAEDQSWRARMQQVLQVEAADEAAKARLSNAFNSGYAAAQASYPACDEAARARAREVAARGARLAGSLASP